MKPVPVFHPSITVSAPTPLRLALLASLALAGGCSTTGDGLFSGEKVDYRSSVVREQPLEVPPDLTQLARDGRYQPQRGVVSASALGAAPSPVAAATASPDAAAVALNQVGGLRIERDGQQRWLVAPQSPDLLWPKLKTFWESQGFKLTQADAPTGVMETDWSENRAQLASDSMRNVLARIMNRVYDSGERDSYRTRLERTAAGTEIYISHRGAIEVYADERRESTTWRARPTDPMLEAEMLSRLLVALGGPAEPARAAAAVTAPKATPASPATPAAVAAPTATSLTLAEPFDRAWRRVGVALDRSGFTVEDRDRAAGVYFVRYVDPKSVGKEEPGFWAKLFGNPVNPLAAQRLRVALKSTDGQTLVSVQNSTGVPETGEHAANIIARLGQELR